MSEARDGKRSSSCHDDCRGMQEHCLCSQVWLEPSALSPGARKPIAGSWGDAQDWHFRDHRPEACSGHSRHLQELDTAASTGSAGSLHVPAKPALCLGRLRLCAAGSCCLQVIKSSASICIVPSLDVELNVAPSTCGLDVTWRRLSDSSASTGWPMTTDTYVATQRALEPGALAVCGARRADELQAIAGRAWCARPLQCCPVC